MLVSSRSYIIFFGGTCNPRDTFLPSMFFLYDQHIKNTCSGRLTNPEHISNVIIDLFFVFTFVPFIAFIVSV